MKNEHIELVKKWLADKDSVSQGELRANAEAARAYAAYDAARAYAAYDADAVDADYASDADWVAYAASDAASADAYGADYWVKRYEELTNDKLD